MAELTNEQLQKLINLGNLQSFKTKLESKIDTTYAKSSDLESVQTTVGENSQGIQTLNTKVGDGTLSTTAQTIVGAINEVNSAMDHLVDDQTFDELSQRVAAVEGKEVDLSGYQTIEAHNADIAGLQETINGKADASALNDYATVESLGDYAKSSDVATIYATKSELSGKADAQHGHAFGEIDGLQNALDAKANASALAEYAKSSELTNYAKASELATLAETVSSNTTAIQNVQGSLSGKADAQHNHEIEEIDGLRGELDGLQNALDTKANASELDNYVLKSNVATDEDIDLLFA